MEESRKMASSKQSLAERFFGFHPKHFLDSFSENIDGSNGTLEASMRTLHARLDEAAANQGMAANGPIRSSVPEQEAVTLNRVRKAFRVNSDVFENFLRKHVLRVPPEARGEVAAALAESASAVGPAPSASEGGASSAEAREEGGEEEPLSPFTPDGAAEDEEALDASIAMLQQACVEEIAKCQRFSKKRRRVQCDRDLADTVAPEYEKLRRELDSAVEAAASSPLAQTLDRLSPEYQHLGEMTALAHSLNEKSRRRQSERRNEEGGAAASRSRGEGRNHGAQRAEAQASEGAMSWQESWALTKRQVGQPTTQGLNKLAGMLKRRR